VNKKQKLGLVLVISAIPLALYMWFFQVAHWGDMTQKQMFLEMWPTALAFIVLALPGVLLGAASRSR
jgi:hypothetical protein